MRDLLTSATRRIRMRDLALLVTGDIVLAVLFGLWLQIPDSHAWQFAFSVLFALLIAAALLWLHAIILRSVRAGATVPRWITAAALLPWALLWWRLNTWSAHIGVDAVQRAGFWNSRLSHGMRHLLTFDRLLSAQMHLITVLVWLVIPALLLPFLVETSTHGIAPRAWRSALHTLASLPHWLAVGAAALLGFYLTRWLLALSHAAAPAVEAISLALRLLILLVLDATVLLALLAVDAELLHRRNLPAAQPTTDGR